MRGALAIIVVAAACAHAAPIARVEPPHVDPWAHDDAPAVVVRRPHDPPWLGVFFDRTAERAHVKSVVPDGPAARAGMRDGDDVIAVDGHQVAGSTEVISRVQWSRAGQRVVVTVERDGRRIDLPVTLEPRPDLRELPRTRLLDKRAPDFSLPGAKLADLAGEIVVVEFWTTWCGPCAMSAPDLEKLHHKYAAQGVHVVGISEDDDASAIAAYARDHALTYPLVHDADGSISRAYFQAALPTLFVIDRDGVVRDVEIGVPDAAALDATIARLVTAPRRSGSP